MCISPVCGNTIAENPLGNSTTNLFYNQMNKERRRSVLITNFSCGLTNTPLEKIALAAVPKYIIFYVIIVMRFPEKEKYYGK